MRERICRARSVILRNSSGAAMSSISWDANLPSSKSFLERTAASIHERDMHRGVSTVRPGAIRIPSSSGRMAYSCPAIRNPLPWLEQAHLRTDEDHSGYGFFCRQDRTDRNSSLLSVMPVRIWSMTHSGTDEDSGTGRIYPASVPSFPSASCLLSLSSLRSFSAGKSENR